MAGADGADETLQDAGVPGHSTHDLSPREREVIRLVAGGRTNRQIAEHLVIARARLILTSATSSQSSICTRAPSWLCGLSSMA
jgi:FixJ family two-component response regulator